MHLSNHRFKVVLCIVCLALWSPKISLAQECGTGAIESIHPSLNRSDLINYIKSNTLNPYLRSAVLDQVPIQLHIVRDNSGNGGVSLATIQNNLATANAFMSNANLEFVLCPEIDYIDNSALLYFNCDVDEDALLINYNPYAMNIYWVPDASCFGGRVSGYNGLHITMANTSGITLAHEIGHFFGLSHTHGKFNSSPPDYSMEPDSTDGFPTPIYYEGVVAYDTGFNDDNNSGENDCYETGDNICDTPAEPVLSGKVNLNCEYIGSDTDYDGATYSPNVGNVMSYGYCRDHFSTEQYEVIRYFYDNYYQEAYLLSCISEFTCATVSGTTNQGPGNTTILNIPTAPATNNVAIILSYYGDFSYQTENFDILDENDQLLGITPTGRDCGPFAVQTIQMAQSTFNNFVSDGILTLTFDPRSFDINPQLCFRNEICAHIDYLAPCEDHISVMNPVTLSVYQANLTITSDANIPDAQQVTFDAGQSVELMPLFSTGSMTELTILTEGCN